MQLRTIQTELLHRMCVRVRFELNVVVFAALTQHSVFAHFFIDGAFTRCFHTLCSHSLTPLVITLTTGGGSNSSCVPLRVLGVWNREGPSPAGGLGPGSQERESWLGPLQWPVPTYRVPSEVLVRRKESPKDSDLAGSREKGTGLWHLPLRRQQCWPGPGRNFDSWKYASAHSLLSYQQSAKEAREQGDGSYYSWWNALLVKYEKCFRNEFPAMVWKQMLDSYFLPPFCFPPLIQFRKTGQESNVWSPAAHMCKGPWIDVRREGSVSRLYALGEPLSTPLLYIRRNWGPLERTRRFPRSRSLTRVF